jgi:hypothetical protein
MVRWRDEIGERRSKAGRGISLSRVCIGLAVFYLVAILLDGDALYRNAEQMPFGPSRTVSLRLSQPLKWISRATGLFRFREWIEQRWNKDKQP